MHAIESKPFEVSNYNDEEEEDMPPTEEENQPVQELPSGEKFTGSFKKSAISNKNNSMQNLDPRERAYKTNPYLKDSGVGKQSKNSDAQ